MNHNLVNHLHVAGNALQNPLPEYMTLFLAKVNIDRSPGFCAVFGPTATCIPRGQEEFCDLVDAIVGLFNEFGILSSLHSVRHGHKYSQGGGTVDETDCDGLTLVWTTSDECGHNRVLGERIKPEDVLIAR